MRCNYKADATIATCINRESAIPVAMAHNKQKITPCAYKSSYCVPARALVLAHGDLPNEKIAWDFAQAEDVLAMHISH